MRILLVGEYSRLHNSLKEGLLELGHEVVIVGSGDGFKNYPVDYRIEQKWENGLRRKVKVALYLLTGFNVTSYLSYKSFVQIQHHLRGFDIVQLVNENSFNCTPKHEKKILQYLFTNNKKSFLLSCGDDYINVNFNFANPERKSNVQPFIDGKIKKKNFENILKFRRREFHDLHHFIMSYVSGIISSDLDYHVALQNHPKYLGLIPNPVNVDKIQPIKLTNNDVVKIFLGVNSESYYKKGLEYFEEALCKIGAEFTDDTDVCITKNVPYSEYITLYDEAHILLDQVYANDQGYNALEAMAKGKVVFTGAEEIFNRYYNIRERVAVNAVPNSDTIVKELRELLCNRAEINKIGIRARAFVEREHHYVKVAQRYVDVWNQ
ncbi:MAG TPA: glycosyltransferase [Flavobacterium sp.]|jgi:glycosyltransferase involved in cell wall biosynthesis